jgi:energy-coupling factor transport system permease protein
VRLAPGSATLLFAGLGTAALLARHLLSAAILAAGLLLLVCLKSERTRRGPYLYGALFTGLGVFLLSPLLALEGSNVLWSGPSVPVLGRLDVTVEELEIAALNGLRLTGVALAFAAYALLVDHDRLVASARFAPRSALAVALATRLVPSLERDAGGLRDAVRGRGVEVAGLRGHARLLSPLVAGSLERAGNLAEAMEARGYGRAGRTVAPGPPWRFADWVAVAAAALLVVAGVLWL